MNRAARLLALVSIAAYVNWHGGLFLSTAIASGKTNLTDVVAARQFLAAAQEAAKGLEKSRDKACAYQAIAAAQVRAGNIAEARRNLEIAKTATDKIADPDAKAGAYLKIADVQAECGDAALARLSLQAARLAAMLMSDESVYKSDYLMDIAEAHAKAGNTMDARRIGEEAVAAASRVGNDHKPFIVERIVEAQAAAGDIAGAKATAAMITDEDCRNNGTDKNGRSNSYALWSKVGAHASIAAAQAEAGDVPGAEVTMSLIHDKEIERDKEVCRQRDQGYVSIAKARATAGDIAGAIADVARITDKQVRAGAYLRVAEARIDVRDVKEARRSLEQAKAALPHIEYDEFNETFYGEPGEINDLYGVYIAAAQARTGDFAAAGATAVQLRLARSRASAFCEIATAQARAGDLTAARKSLAEARKGASQILLSPEEKAGAYVRIATLRQEIGDHAGACEDLLRARNAWAATDGDYSGASADVLRAKNTWAVVNLCRVIATVMEILAHEAPAVENNVSEERSSEKAEVLIYVAAAQARIQGAAETRPTLDKAEAILSLGQGDSWDEDFNRDICCRIATVRAKIGDVVEAFALIARAIDDKAARCQAFAKIAEELSSPGSTDLLQWPARCGS